MKKSRIILALVFLSLTTIVVAQDSTRFTIPLKNWEVKVIGLNNFYPTYLADPLGVRFEVSRQNIIYSDYEFFDEVNNGGDYLGKLVINPGVRISLFKFSPKSNPKLGVEVDLGLTIPTFMRAGNHDVIGLDGIYYFAIAGKPTEWLALRFSKHHICTHIGDEYYTGKVKTPIDYDPNTTQLPVRDDFIISAAVKPLYFLGDPSWDILQVYGDFGFFYQGVDFLGTRQNKPNKHAWLNIQGGAELEYYFPNKYIGGLFAAYNISAYQSNAFARNVSIMGGYIFPQDGLGRKFRIGINYYNGRAWSNQFYNRRDKFIAFSLAMDV